MMGTSGSERVNRGDKGEGMWLMDFIYLHKIDCSETSCNCFNWGGEGVERERGWR
jgi:hypothetical protein